MKVNVINHPSGDQLPLLIDADGLPLPAPNEFIIGRRSLSTNTLVRNLRELAVLYRWLERNNLDLWKYISTEHSFSEAMVRGGLVEALRRDQDGRGKVKQIAVKPHTFNQRLTTIRQYLAWCFDVELGSLPINEPLFDSIREHKNRVIKWLHDSFINAPPVNKGASKGLTEQEISFLVAKLDPENCDAFGNDPAVRYRNYIATMIMLNYGLRPGELLSLKVEDVEIGAISSIRIVRRAPDPNDLRKPRPQIKRNGRVLPIVDARFAQRIDEYVLKWRDVLEQKSKTESDYLILSDEGEPLSQSSIIQFYQILRNKFPLNLPENLTAKALRHTFSSLMEREMREAGISEDRRREALAMLRGDSSLGSQSVYIAQEIEEQAALALKKYQQKLMAQDTSS